jgi:hypothetical protein
VKCSSSTGRKSPKPRAVPCIETYFQERPEKKFRIAK